MPDPSAQDPSASADTLWPQARSAFRRRDYPAAADLLARLVEAHDGATGVDMAELRLLYGVTLLRLGRPEEGVAELKLAAELDPENPRAHQKFGSGLARLGQDEEALPHLERAAAMAPGNAEYQWRVGEQYRRLGRSIDARRAFERSLELQPGYDRPTAGLEALTRRDSSWLTRLARRLKGKPGS